MKQFSRSDIKLLDQQQVYQGFVNLSKLRLQFRLFAGGWSAAIERDLVTLSPVVAVLLYDPKLDQVVLTEQVRVGALADDHSPWLIELVAGYIDQGESPVEAAKREAKEETNLKLEQMVPLYHYWVSPGGSTGRVALYCAQVDATEAGGIFGVKNEQEDIRVVTMSTQQAFAAIAEGRINNGSTIIALQWLQIHQQQINEQWLDN